MRIHLQTLCTHTKKTINITLYIIDGRDEAKHRTHFDNVEYAK